MLILMSGEPGMKSLPTPPSRHAASDVWDAYAKTMLRWLVANVERTETSGMNLSAQWERPNQGLVMRAEAFFCLNCSELHVGLFTYGLDDDGDLELLMEERVDPAAVR